MIKRYIKNYEILLFVFLTFLFSWTIWGILYISSISIIDNNIYKKYFSALACLGAYGPSIMSIILTAFLYKKSGLKKLLLRLTKWRYNAIYYIIAIFGVPVLTYISYLVCKYIGFTGEVKLITNPYFILASFTTILFFGGPLNEEIGWRGFLLPNFQKNLNPLWSSIIVGIVWACWHLPLFFIAGTSQYGYPFGLFMVSAILLSILITWLFNRTKGSLVFPILLHTAYNTSTAIMSGIDDFFVGKEHILTSKVYINLGISMIAVIFIVIDMFKQSKFDIIYK